jgi:hypothetical protein
MNETSTQVFTFLEEFKILKKNSSSWLCGGFDFVHGMLLRPELMTNELWKSH